LCRFPASATGETDNAMSPGLRRRIIVIGSLLSVLWAFFVGVGGYSEQFGGSRIFLAVAVQLGGVVFWMALTRSLYGRRMKNAQVPDRSRFQFAGSAGLRSRGSQASCVRIHPVSEEEDSCLCSSCRDVLLGFGRPAVCAVQM
jgi:hypothetical protein